MCLSLQGPLLVYCLVGAKLIGATPPTLHPEIIDVYVLSINVQKYTKFN